MWKISKNDKLNFIDNNSLDEFQINDGINFLVGNNNSGKSLLLRAIKDLNINIWADGKVIKPNIVYLDTNSKNLNGENTKKNQIMQGSLVDFIEKYNDYGEDITEKIISNFHNSKIISSFINNKKIETEKIVQTKITTSIDGVRSEISGDGENRILYLVYILSSLMNDLELKFNQIKNDITIIKNLVSEHYEWKFVKKSFENWVYSSKNFFSGSIVNERRLTSEDVELINNVLELICEQGSYIEKNYLLSLYYEGIIPNKHSIDSGYNIYKYHSDKVDFENFYNKVLVDSGEINNWVSSNKNKIIRFYLENIDLTNAISFDFLVMMDEPELYIHQSKFALVNELMENLLNLGKEYGVDIRLLVVTHDERIIKNHPKHIQNINIARKDGNVIFYKNIFSNNINKFVASLQNDIEKYFVNANIEGLFIGPKHNSQESINLRLQSIDESYIRWFLLHKDNLKIFLSDSILVAEGFHDKLMLTKMVMKNNDEHQVIETDGTREGALIWSKLIRDNIDFFKHVEFFIDLDFKMNDEKFGLYSHTQLVRKYYRNLFEGCKNVVIRNSLLNDITQYIEYSDLSIKHQEEVQNANYKYPNSNKDYTSNHLEDFVLETCKINSKFINSFKINSNYPKNEYNNYALECAIDNMDERAFDGSLNHNVPSPIFNKFEISTSIDDYFRLVSSRQNFDSLNKEKKYSALGIIDGKLYTSPLFYEGDFFGKEPPKYEIILNDEFIFDHKTYEIIVDYNISIFIDFVNKKIIWVHAEAYDDRDFAVGESPKLIESKLFIYDEIYINLLKSNTIKFVIDGENHYICPASFLGRNKIIVGDEEMNKIEFMNVYSHFVGVRLLGTNIKFNENIFKISSEMTYFNELKSHLEGEHFAFLSITKSNGRDDEGYLVGPYKLSEVGEKIHEFKSQEWFKWINNN